MKSLDNLVETLNEDNLKITRSEFRNEDQFKLMKRKGVFPYDFFHNHQKLNYDCFPKREAFFNLLYGKECSEKDYLHAKLVWNTFSCKTFKDYHDLYLKADVLLLADFFEKFRDQCMVAYGLDPTHYYTAPGMPL